MAKGDKKARIKELERIVQSQEILINELTLMNDKLLRSGVVWTDQTRQHTGTID